MPRERANPWLNTTTRPKPVSPAWRQRLGLDAALPMPWEGTPLPREPRPPRAPWYRDTPAYRAAQEMAPMWPEVSDEERQAWVDANPFVRAGLSKATQKAMANIARFARKV